MIALATVDRPHFADGTVLDDRGDGRSRAPPRQGDGGADAVLQSGTEGGSATPSVRALIKVPARVTAWTFDRLLTGLVFLAIGVACALTPMQTDTWWQLRAGRDMWVSRSVLLTDVYSHTAYGTFWTNHEWLAEVVFYGLVKAGGLPLLTLFAPG